MITLNLNTSAPARSTGAAGMPSFDLAARLSRLHPVLANVAAVDAIIALLVVFIVHAPTL